MPIHASDPMRRFQPWAAASTASHASEKVHEAPTPSEKESTVKPASGNDARFYPSSKEDSIGDPEIPIQEKRVSERSQGILPVFDSERFFDLQAQLAAHVHHGKKAMHFLVSYDRFPDDIVHEDLSRWMRQVKKAGIPEKMDSTINLMQNHLLNVNRLEKQFMEMDKHIQPFMRTLATLEKKIASTIPLAEEAKFVSEEVEKIVRSSGMIDPLFPEVAKILSKYLYGEKEAIHKLQANFLYQRGCDAKIVEYYTSMQKKLHEIEQAIDPSHQQKGHLSMKEFGTLAMALSDMNDRFARYLIPLEPASPEAPSAASASTHDQITPALREDVPAQRARPVTPEKRVPASAPPEHPAAPLASTQDASKDSAAESALPATDTYEEQPNRSRKLS